MQQVAKYRFHLWFIGWIRHDLLARNYGIPHLKNITLWKYSVGRLFFVIAVFTRRHIAIYFFFHGIFFFFLMMGFIKSWDSFFRRETKSNFRSIESIHAKRTCCIPFCLQVKPPRVLRNLYKITYNGRCICVYTYT